MRTLTRMLKLLSALAVLLGVAPIAYAVTVEFNGATADLSIVETTGKEISHGQRSTTVSDRNRE